MIDGPPKTSAERAHRLRDAAWPPLRWRGAVLAGGKAPPWVRPTRAHHSSRPLLRSCHRPSERPLLRPRRRGLPSRRSVRRRWCWCGVFCEPRPEHAALRWKRFPDRPVRIHPMRRVEAPRHVRRGEGPRAVLYRQGGIGSAPEQLSRRCTSAGPRPAEAACEERGARLCTEPEWELACEGEEMLPFPYGYVRDSVESQFDRTDLGKMGEGLTDHRAPPEAFPHCVSPFGVRRARPRSGMSTSGPPA